MTPILRVTARFLQPYSHGRGEDGRPEWPPSPLRLFQALVSSAVGRTFDPEKRARAVVALQWLERLPAPEIVAPRAIETSSPCRTYVPDNASDRVARAWSAGRDADASEYRSEKDIRPVRLEGEAVHYLYRDADGLESHLATLCAAARSMTHLGWGIDMVAGDAASGEHDIVGERWIPRSHGRRSLRSPIAGTLAALEHKHGQFLQRLEGGTLRPVAPLASFAVHSYARVTDPIACPVAAFRILAPLTGKRLMLDPARRARDVAAWVRHAVAEACEGWPFGPTALVVHGHGDDSHITRNRFSYLPLPTITPLRVEGIARVLIAGTPDLEAETAWVRAHLAGQELVWRGRSVGLLEPLTLGDWVLGKYVEQCDRWSTVSPVILPGHDDRSSRKTERLLRRAFVHAGIDPHVVDSIRELEWRQVGFRPGVDLASRYLPPDKVRGPCLHVRVRFSGPLVGPIAIGSGRHRGLGIFAEERT